MAKNNVKGGYKLLVNQIKSLVDQTKQHVAQQVNTALLRTYWLVGKLLVEKERSERYDELSVRQMLVEVSKVLTRDLGKGFSRSQLTYMRLFYLKFPVFVEKKGKPISGLTLSDQSGTKLKKTSGLTVSDQLSWSHYYELLQCDADIEIKFYLDAAIIENWSVRELRRQMDTALFERIVLSKNTKQLKKIKGKGTLSDRFTDFNRDPYVLEFLNIPENKKYSERYLEQRIIDNLQSFILEIGKGFAFIGRQFRITLGNKHYYVDLVFYHRILKCFILIDLKTDAVRHNDIGQMNLYLNYFEVEQNEESDGQPIGIILSKRKDDISVEYAMRGLTSKIITTKFQTYLPDKRALQRRVRELLF
jgi:predicted nuclease of restriction endonuclease-like (RecB) superfamily